MHSHKGGVSMYKLNDEKKKQQLLNRLDQQIQLQSRNRSVMQINLTASPHI